MKKLLSFVLAAVAAAGMWARILSNANMTCASWNEFNRKTTIMLLPPAPLSLFHDKLQCLAAHLPMLC